MLALLVRLSIRYYGLVIALALLIVGYGGLRLASAGLDIFPEFSPKQVIIQTEAPGFSAEQVETLVSQVIENSLSGLIGLTSMRSESIQGLSIVTAIFEDDSDIHRNRQRVSERLSTLAGQLPATVNTPAPVPLSSSSATVMTIGLSGSAQNLMHLRSMVDWILVPRLLTVPGVADVNIFGGEIRQLQIQIRPERLLRFQLGVDDIIKAAEQAVNTRGGGFIENQNQRFTLKVTGQPQSPEQLKQIVVKNFNGQPLLLGDVADIDYGPEAPIGAAQIGGQPGIVMMIIGQYGANTLSVTRAVERELQQFQPLFAKQGIDFHSSLFRPADYIETSLNNLTGHLLIGCFFVIIILFVFLYNLRTALISAVAIPVSLIGAALILLEAGINLNIMVLGGLAIALGEVVDDAIIDTENIFRRLRLNQQESKPKPVADIVYAASMEVRSSVVYASFIVALVFVPLLTLSGVAGRLFAPLGLSYILAILVSLLVALSLTPALCYCLLARKKLNNQEAPIIKYIQPGYLALLRTVSGYANTAIMLSVLFCALGAILLSQFNNKFLPELREGHYIVHTTSIPGTSLTESIRIGKQLTQSFLAIDGVQSVSQWAGRAERGADTYGSHYSEYEVRLAPMPGADQQQVLERLRLILKQFPGILYEANTFLTERIDETISGYTAPIVVNVYGNNLTKLEQYAQAIAEVIAEIPGARNVQLRSPPGTPLLQIQMRLDKMALWGIPPQQVAETIQAAYEGRRVGKQFDANRMTDIVVALAPELRTDPEQLGRLPIRNNDGLMINLDQLADLHFTESRYNVLHRGNQRLQTVTAAVDDRDVESFMAELKTKVLTEIDFDSDIYPEFTGAAIAQAKARQSLILHSLLATTGVLILIYIAIGNVRNMLITLANIPFSLIGGVLAVLLTGATLSVGSVVGFITLFGITVRNSIMLISHYQHLIAVEAKTWNLATAMQGAQERMPSIVMTALVTALAMLPIAFDSDNAGREIMGPMAAIIIGGLTSSTLLNLILLPALLLRYGQFQSSDDQALTIPGKPFES